MKVVVGVDGSPAAKEAVRQAARMLMPENDTLVLYYAPPTFRAERSSAVDPAITNRAREALATAVFDDALSVIPEPMRGKAKRVIGTRDPRQGLLLAAEEQHADLVAMGARGLGPLQRLLLGSVSSAVAQASPLPVLIARHVADRRLDEPLKVLLACERARTSKHAAEFLHRISWPTGTVGRVITVLGSIFNGEVPAWLEAEARSADAEAIAHAWVSEHDEAIQATLAELASLCELLPKPFHGHAPLVAEGNAAQQILKVIDADSIDLVVLDARRLSALQRAFFGSTSANVLSHAPCSVLLLHQIAAS